MLRQATLIFIGLFLLHVAGNAHAGHWDCAKNGDLTSSSGDKGGVQVTQPIYCVYTNDLSDFGGGGGGGANTGGAPGSGAGDGAGSPQESNNPKDNTTAEQAKSQNTCPSVADPIDMANGVKFEAVTDFDTGGEMGLKFGRYYVSQSLHGGSLGGWTDSLAYDLSSTCQSGIPGSCTTVRFWRPDGSMLMFTQGFTQPHNGDSLIGPFAEVGGEGHAALHFAPNIDGGNGVYTLLDDDGMTYTFLEHEGLSSITSTTGIGWRVRHLTGSAVTTVQHSNGQTMTLTTSTEGTSSVLTVVDPAGNNYVYKSVPGSGIAEHLMPMNLATVILPGSTPTTITYGYVGINTGNPSALGLHEVDYNGVPHDLTTYDAAGRANGTSAGDGSHAISLVYGSNATGGTATLTNELGHVTAYQYDGNHALIAIAGQASAHCAANFSNTTYDANGYLQSSTDGNGVTTKYTYAGSGQLQSRVEAFGLPEQRTITMAWDPTLGFDRILSTTLAGLSRTTMTYNGQSRISSITRTNLSSVGTANQALTTTYAYALYPSGMVQALSVTHPSPGNSNTDVSQYDSLGNLTSVANGLGHTTTYSNYNAMGLPGRVVGPNGDITDATFDARGLLLSQTTYPNGVAAQAVYEYDALGMVKKATTPDGRITTYARDAFGQLTSVTRNDKDGDSIETFGRDNMGNVTSYALKRGSDVGLSWTASYDELGRLYQKMGNHGQSLTYTYDGNGNTRTITNALGHVTTYDYDGLNRVVNVTESGGATQIAPTGVTTVIVPPTSSTGNYVVSWAAVTNATSYRLEEQINGGTWSLVQNSGASSWPASGKANGVYAYRVTACNTLAPGCGPVSATATTTVTLQPTSAPVLTAPATNNTGAYSVTWAGVANATTYTLQERVNGGAWTTVQNTAALSWTISGHGSATYGYQVLACSTSGCGPASALVNVVVTLPPTGVPALTVPTQSFNGSYTVSWTAVAVAATYELDEQVNGGAWVAVQNTAAASWAISGKPAATYGYRVRACNAGGCAGYSGTSSVVVTLPPASAPALSVPSINSNGSFTISWSGVAGAASYQLLEQINGGGWTQVQNTAATSWATAGRSTGSYGYQVVACNIAGCGPPSGVGVVAESVPIPINGQTYSALGLIAQGKQAASSIGFQIVSGTTWQVISTTYSNATKLSRTVTSGPVPASAVTVQYTWTPAGAPVGDGDSAGSLGLAASTAISSNPASAYTTAFFTFKPMTYGRLYSLRVDFFNVIGVNISSSTATMKAEVTGSP